GLSTSCQRISSPSAFVRPASAGVAAFMFCVIVTSGVRRCLSGLRCEPTRGVHHPTDVRSCGSASAGDIGRVCAPSARTTAFGSCTFLRQQGTQVVFVVRETKFPARLLVAAVGIGAGLGALISVASSGLAAYFARRIVVPENAPEELDILHIDGFPPNMRIHLPADEETTGPGTDGLYFNQGAGQAVIGDIVEYDPRSRTVSREIRSVTRGDIRRAWRGRWTGIVFPDPLAAGVNFDDIEIRSDAGALPAWLLPSDHPEPHETWAILIH